MRAFWYAWLSLNISYLGMLITVTTVVVSNRGYIRETHQGVKDIKTQLAGLVALLTASKLAAKE